MALYLSGLLSKVCNSNLIMGIYQTNSNEEHSAIGVVLRLSKSSKIKEIKESSPPRVVYGYLETKGNMESWKGS